MNEISKLKKQLSRMEHRLEELQEEFDEVYDRLTALEGEDEAKMHDYLNEDEDDD